METLAALSLASNIVQFIHFGASLLSEASERYYSLAGATIGHAELDDIAQNLRGLTLNLEVSATATHYQPFQKICRRCKAVADELLEALEALRVTGKRRKWESVKQAIRSIAHEKKIEDLKSRLDDLQSAMLLCLVDAMRDEQSQLHASLNGLREQHKRMEISGYENLQVLKQNLIQALEAAHEESSKNTTELLSSYQEELNLLLETSRHAAAAQTVIRSLKYEHMAARLQSIEEAHKRSFDWIFECADKHQKRHHFLEWLESGDGLFWVAGRAGSGKSTLMKYIVEHPNTETFAKRWAGSKSLVTASHFFWIAGNQMQKSQQGLLLSLLDDIFTRCPELIPLLTPSRWEDAMFQKMHTDQWSRRELTQAFTVLKCQTQIPVRFCFFIDGLDEYDGDHAEIVQILQDLAALKDIKVCVSSRPWNVFEKTIGVHNSGELYLEELTSNDIRIYVRETLALDPRVIELENDANGSVKTQIIEDIVTQAHGVFLWVVLVVRDLRRGLVNGDTGAVLQKRLASIPPTLEGFFQMMLNRIDEVYREQTAQIISIVLRAPWTLHLLMFAFLDKYQTASVLESPISFKSWQEVESLSLKTRTRVKARCCDLLEVKSSPPFASTDPTAVFLSTLGTVHFIHRTARDFALTPKVQIQLRRHLTSHFEPELYCCESLLLQLKMLKFYDPEKSAALSYILSDFMGYASNLERVGAFVNLALFDELERVLTHHRINDLPHAPNSARPYYVSGKPSVCEIIPERFSQAPPGTNVFQAAIQLRLHRYVEKRLVSEPTLAGGLQKFLPLETVLEHSLNRLEAYRQPDITMLKLILSYGASPCQLIPKQGKTVWGSFINATLHHIMFGQGLRTIEDILALLIQAAPTGDSEIVADLRPDGRLARGINHKPTMKRLRRIANGRSQSEWGPDWLHSWFCCCRPRVNRRTEWTESETRPLLSSSA